jgi:hypothetical protein
MSTRTLERASVLQFLGKKKGDYDASPFFFADVSSRCQAPFGNALLRRSGWRIAKPLDKSIEHSNSYLYLSVF